MSRCHQPARRARRIRAGDRVGAVLARDERLLDVFVAASPAFEKLRNGAMRKTMARLVTVEQAARIAGIDAGELVARLNDALDRAPSRPPARRRTDGRGSAQPRTADPRRVDQPAGGSTRRV